MGFRDDFADLLGDMTDAENFGVSVVYARGDDIISDLTAAPVAPMFDTIMAGGQVTDVELRDFLIPVAELVLDGAAVEPQRGDRITETIHGVDVTYEVMDGPNGAWRFEDPGHSHYRVSAKKITVPSS